MGDTAFDAFCVQVQREVQPHVLHVDDTVAGVLCFVTGQSERTVGELTVATAAQLRLEKVQVIHEVSSGRYELSAVSVQLLAWGWVCVDYRRDGASQTTHGTSPRCRAPSPRFPGEGCIGRCGSSGDVTPASLRVGEAGHRLQAFYLPGVVVFVQGLEGEHGAAVELAEEGVCPGLLQPFAPVHVSNGIEHGPLRFFEGSQQL